MKLCPICADNDLRRARLVELVTDEELRNPAFLIAFRAFTSALGIQPEAWPDYLMDIYRDFEGCITDRERHLIGLNTEHLEVYPEWYRDWVNTAVPPGIVPRLRKESRARIRVLVTLLKIRFPEESAGWGVHPANDNDPGGHVWLVK
ncbi:MAG: hypothetical protein AAGB16_04270 [Pseudomonadota bacterium]